MTVTLVSTHWAGNKRIQRAANNQPPMRQNDGDKVAVKLLQQALIQSGLPMAGGDAGADRPRTQRFGLGAGRPL